MHGMCDKHPPGARCDLGLTNGEREQWPMGTGGSKRIDGKTHERLPVYLGLVFIMLSFCNSLM